MLTWHESGIQEAIKEAKSAFLTYLVKNYGGWDEIVKHGLRYGLKAAAKALRALKHDLIMFCRNRSEDIRRAIHNCNREPKILAEVGSSGIMKGLSRYAVSKGAEKAATAILKEATTTAIEKTTVAAVRKTAAIAVQRTGINGITRVATKKTVSAAVKQSVKVVGQESVKLGSKGLLKAANPIGIAADCAQALLEVTGHKEAGKTVGVLGNMTSGAMIGGATFGPPGAVVGALGSLLLWVGGEVVGSGVEKTINWSMS